MPDRREIVRWVEKIRSRYTSYLTTSFYFRDPALRRSFRSALSGEELLRGPYPEFGRRFPKGVSAQELTSEAFPFGADDLFPALLDGRLHAHQERAIRAAHFEDRNIVVASGTASGKTECFLYPILFSLFGERLSGTVDEEGVRAVVLYPMNALVNDQRERLGDLRRRLDEHESGFEFTFGQYIGQTPYNSRDRYRHGAERGRNALPGEIVFREEMWEKPPHILFTNYSMLEYLLLRPQDTPLFDGGRGKHWRFLVLDEAHAYRGAKGIEMAMLVRRLKQRLREGGRTGQFRCIATSATIASGHGREDRRTVADFATTLFGEEFEEEGVVFGRPESRSGAEVDDIRRHHVFVRALEGAFLLHQEGGDRVVLNRVVGESASKSPAVPLEIALCRECGQHYYVGREQEGRLVEAVRDRSRRDFGVDFFYPLPADERRASALSLCRRCGAVGRGATGCGCGVEVAVQKCANRVGHPDQIKKCESCEYARGGVGDPVQEIVHGADGPNAVLATAVHELLPPAARRILAFADSRQDAAFFAWYAEDSYSTIRDRNLMAAALRRTTEGPRGAGERHDEGLSVVDLGQRLAAVRSEGGLTKAADSWETEIRFSHEAVLREAVAEDARLSLSGVGLATWTVAIPDDLDVPADFLGPPWNLSRPEARLLLEHLLDGFRRERALVLPKSPEFPAWKAVSSRPTMAFTRGTPAGRAKVREWGGARSAVVRRFLPRIAEADGLGPAAVREASRSLMKAIWVALRDRDEAVGGDDRMLEPSGPAGAFALNAGWLRVRAARSSELWECRTCARLTGRNIRGVCPRNRCPGILAPADRGRLTENHYRSLYEATDLPPTLRAAEHTAQLADDEARRRQTEFKSGSIHLLSSSTTFEVGVDLGALEVTFLRNVPPEPFNYAQRVGRAGRAERSGLALTYCRRNPHDLHHFSDPKSLIEGRVTPPRLLVSNERIVTRHMTAIALSAFFRDSLGRRRLSRVSEFIGPEWRPQSAPEALRQFCGSDRAPLTSLRRVVPPDMHEVLGLHDGGWIERIAGAKSRLARAAEEVCDEFLTLGRVAEEFTRTLDSRIGRITRRRKTIAGMDVVQFLARKAVIPKYGFPVDVVELHTGSWREGESVQLDRDLSVAISEYAPGSRVVANKLEWQSCGIRRVEGREPPRRLYAYDQQRFLATNLGDAEGLGDGRLPKGKYLVPEFGFVVSDKEKPNPPERRSQRLFSTRPFFRNFVNTKSPPVERSVLGVRVSEPQPGELVVLCEGKEERGFHLCGACGRYAEEPGPQHTAPWGGPCSGIFGRFSLGHEVTTDVVRARFPGALDVAGLYSLAYALVLGAADALAVPQQDLDVTLSDDAIVLYDDVPGGAGLVRQLTDERAFRRVLEMSRDRVDGRCRCDRSCYGCLRSYRNQFVHTHLDRGKALAVLDKVLRRTG